MTDTPVYRKRGGFTYAIHGTSSLSYVEVLEAEIAELKEKVADLSEESATKTIFSQYHHLLGVQDSNEWLQTSRAFLSRLLDVVDSPYNLAISNFEMIRDLSGTAFISAVTLTSLGNRIHEQEDTPMGAQVQFEFSVMSVGQVVIVLSAECLNAEDPRAVMSSKYRTKRALEVSSQCAELRRQLREKQEELDNLSLSETHSGEL